MRVVNLLIVSIFTMLSVMSAVVGYWIFEPVKECTVTENARTIDEFGGEKTQFKAGEMLRIRRDMASRCRMTYIKVWRTISKERNHEVVASDEFLPTPIKETGETRTSAFRLPAFMQPGMYVYRVFITYQLNPLRDGTFEMMPPVIFEVVP